MEYLYSLQKYKGKATRHACPQCNKANSFTLYINNSTGEPINELVGRCNRVDKCGYHHTPSQWFKDNPKDEHIKLPEPYIQKYTVIKPIGIIPNKYLEDSIGTGSNFSQFLYSLFDKDKCLNAMQRYHIGQFYDGKVIFWQVDKDNNIRTGKIMQYNPLTGKRIKNRNDSIDWMHSHLKRNGGLPNDFNLAQCLFGEHLLTLHPEAPTIIVESEKTAVICSILKPKYIWLATGGKCNFTTEKLNPLKGRNIIAYPDLGAYSHWNNKSREIKDTHIVVSNLLENTATDSEREDGLDIADYLIREIKQI